MDEFLDLHNYLLATPDSFRKLRYVPDTPVKDEEVALKVDEVSITGEDAFIAQAPLRPKVDFRSIRFWRCQSRVEDTCSEGGGRGGNGRGIVQTSHVGGTSPFPSPSFPLHQMSNCYYTRVRTGYFPY